MRDVLGTDCLFRKATLEGRAKRRVAVYLQELVQELDLMDPRAWAPMCQLRQIRERGGAEIDQVLTLQIAPRALARCRGDTLCPVLRFGAVLPFPAFENRAESLMSAGFSGTNPTPLRHPKSSGDRCKKATPIRDGVADLIPSSGSQPP